MVFSSSATVYGDPAEIPIKETTPLGITTNPAMNKAFLVGLVLQLIVLLVPPVMSIFEVVYLNVWEYVAVLGLSLVPVIISEIEKAIRKVTKK